MQKRRRSPVSIATLAVIVAAGAAGTACRGGDAQVQASYDQSGKLRLLTYDSNNNGKPDTWSYMDGTRIVRVELDGNEDGVVDRWEYHNPAGVLEKVGTSQENDGRADTWTYPAADGSTARIERSLRRDGHVSRTEHYVGGAIVKAEEDADNDGAVDKWEEYADGRLVSVAFDTQKAGRPTRRLVYDRSGRLLPGDSQSGGRPLVKP
jgi:hypothetical protein